MVTIDLQKDSVLIQQMIAEAVGKFVDKQTSAKTAKKHPAVTRIDLIFSLGDSESIPWVHLNFDTDPDGEPDGDPSHPDFGKLSIKPWRAAVRAVCEDEEVNVILPTGKTKSCDGEGLTEVVGECLVKCLLTANKNGTFKDLIKAKRCELGVEDPDCGEFGWPAYEDRGKKNLVK